MKRTCAGDHHVEIAFDGEGLTCQCGLGSEAELMKRLRVDRPIPELTNNQRRVEEVRVVDPNTGGEKGQKPAQLSALDPVALLHLATVAGFGSTKYARLNYLKGYAWSLSLDALFRHVLAFAGGENYDPESGEPHLAHAAWHALALTSFLERNLGTDDRVSALPNLQPANRK